MVSLRKPSFQMVRCAVLPRFRPCRLRGDYCLLLINDYVVWNAMTSCRICPPEVAKGSFWEHWPWNLELTLLLGEMLNVASCGPHGGKLSLLCQDWYICSTWKKQDLHFDRYIKRTSATTLVSVKNTLMFWTSLITPTEHRTVWPRLTRFPSPRRWVALHAYLLYFGRGLWWRVHTFKTTHVFQSSQGLQYCSSHLHNAWWSLCLAQADRNILPLRYWYISDAALSPDMLSCAMFSPIIIESSPQIHRLPLHSLHHCHIFLVGNILSNFYTL